MKEVVEYITMGKFMDCAVVLQKVTNRPTEADEHLRGTSTRMGVGKANFIWKQVRKQQKAGGEIIQKSSRQRPQDVSSIADTFLAKFCLPHVSQKIFLDLSYEDIINCSQVDRHWERDRSVLDTT